MQISKEALDLKYQHQLLAMARALAPTALPPASGTRKPRNPRSPGRFSALYKHYPRLVERR